MVSSAHVQQPYLLQENIKSWRVDLKLVELFFVIWGFLPRKRSTKLRTQNHGEIPAKWGAPELKCQQLHRTPSLKPLRAETKPLTSESHLRCPAESFPSITLHRYPALNPLISETSNDWTMRSHSKPALSPCTWYRLHLNSSLSCTSTESLNLAQPGLLLDLLLFDHCYPVSVWKKRKSQFAYS